MDLAAKIYEMNKAGFSVGFKQSKMGDQYVAMVLKKGNARTDYDMTAAAFQTDQLLIHVLNDAEAELIKDSYKQKK
jgi:hypothetical protein